jgi:hypothetical protein
MQQVTGVIRMERMSKKGVLDHPYAVFNTADFRNCKRLNCLFIDHCKKEHSENKRPECIHPEEQIIYQIEQRFNATGDSFVSNVLKHFRGTAQPSLKFDKVVLSTRASIPDSTSTIAEDGLEIIRKSVTNGGTDPDVTSTVTILTSEAITYTALVIGTPTTRNQFTVASAGGFKSGDLVDFMQTGTLGTKENLEILSIVGQIVTLTSDLDAIPVAGNTLKQKIGRIYLIDINDVVISVFSYRRLKTSDQQIAITYTATLRGT